MKYISAVICLFLIGCGSSGEHVFRIRTDDGTEKKYVLHYVMDSSLIVQDYYPVRRGAYSIIPLDTIHIIWHRWSTVTSNIRTGALIGAVSGFLFGGIYSRLDDTRSPQGAPLFGLSAAGVGAIIASSIPSDDLMLLPEDTFALPFLREHAKRRSLEDFPVGVLDSLLTR